VRSPNNVTRPEQFGDDELMEEVCRRFERTAVNVWKAIQAAESVDWPAAARTLAALPPGAKWPRELYQEMDIMDKFHAARFLLPRYDPALQMHRYRGTFSRGDIPYDELKPQALFDRIRAIRQRLPDLEAAMAWCTREFSW
jgi:hypothetical protein